MVFRTKKPANVSSPRCPFCPTPNQPATQKGRRNAGIFGEPLFGFSLQGPHLCAWHGCLGRCDPAGGSHFGREKWWGFGGPGLFLGNTDVGWVFEVRSSLEMVRSWETTRWDTPTLGISCSRSCQSCVCWFRLTPLTDMGNGRLLPIILPYWALGESLAIQLYQPF